MVASISSSLIILGIVILAFSLLTAKKIFRRLANTDASRNWKIMIGLIVFFILGYFGYLFAFWNQQTNLFDLIVPGIFFFGAIFVWFSTYLALQTTTEIVRISELESQTITDPLTKAYNRRFLEQRLTEEVYKAHRNELELALLMIDLDHFKKINDKYGHLAGDQVLIEIVNLVKDELRLSDHLARYGGEEFIVIAPDTSVKNGWKLADRIRKSIEKHLFLPQHKGLQSHGISVTVSIGVANLGEKIRSEKDLVSLADNNLYRAKKAGRNQVAVEAAAENMASY